MHVENQSAAAAPEHKQRADGRSLPPEAEEVVVDLSVSESAIESWIVLEVKGEVDVHSAPELLKRVSKVLDSGNKSVVIDLNGLAFIDSTGLGALVAARNQSTEADATLRLVCNSERILKLFRITGLQDVFDIYPGVGEAVAAG
jgi:anti-sigma B factor antagonist